MESPSKRAKSSLPPTYVEGFHDKEAVQRMKYTPLGAYSSAAEPRAGDTGMEVSLLSFGASSLGSVFRCEPHRLGFTRDAGRPTLLNHAVWFTLP